MGNSKKEIFDEIIKIISNNNLTILEAKEILRIVSKKLDNQKVTIDVLNANTALDNAIPSECY